MDLREWRSQQAAGQPFELPSGLVVHLRRLGLLDLLAQGAIPAPLVGMVESLTERKESRLKLEEFVEFGQTINLVVKTACIDPPVADQGSETAVGLDELSMEDRVAIFNWANQPAEGLRPFRPAPR